MAARTLPPSRRPLRGPPPTRAVSRCPSAAEKGTSMWSQAHARGEGHPGKGNRAVGKGSGYGFYPGAAPSTAGGQSTAATCTTTIFLVTYCCPSGPGQRCYPGGSVKV